LGELGTLSSVRKFRALAKKLLLVDPKSIGEVVSIAHSRGIQTKKSDGGGALIAQLLKTRGLLSAKDLSETEMIDIVDQTISKH
jgi:hypothetical protein